MFLEKGKTIKLNNIYECMMILFGILAPAPLLTFFSVTFYVWFVLFIGSIAALILFRDGFIAKYIDKWFICYFVLSLISYALCKIVMPSDWSSGLLTAFMQWMLLLVIVIVLSQPRKRYLLKFYLKGVYYSAIIQMIWGYLQLFLYQFGVNLNDIIFVDFLHTKVGTVTATSYFGIKISGLCWNAGNFAPLMVYGYVLTKSRLLKIAFIIVSLLSGSRALLAGIITCLGVDFLLFVLTKRKVKKRTVILTIVAVCTCVVLIIVKLDWVVEKIAQFMWLFDLVNNYDKEPSTYVHLRYILSIPDIFKRNSIITNIFGYGPGCSGYPFSTFYNQYTGRGAWVVECDYVNILWSFGIAGAVAYYVWWFSAAWRVCKQERSFITLFISFAVMGLAYNITFNWVFLMIVCFGVLSKNEKIKKDFIYE